MSNVARRRMKVSLCRAMIVGAVSLVLIAVSFHGGVDERNGPRELDSAVSEIFLGFQAAKSR